MLRFSFTVPAIKRNFWRHVKEVVPIKRVADIRATMRKKSLPERSWRDDIAMILADPHQRFLAKHAFEEPLIFKESVEILVCPEFPSHVARRAQPLKAIPHCAVNKLA